MTFMSYETIQFTEYLMYFFTSGKRFFTKQFFFKDKFSYLSHGCWGKAFADSNIKIKGWRGTKKYFETLVES